MAAGGHNDDTEILSERPTSTVTRVASKSPDGPRFFAVKTSTTMRAVEPHDIIKEVRLLASLSHPNIVPLIKHDLSQGSQNLTLWMPYIPYSLDELLQSSRFSPHPIISFGKATSPSLTPREVQFVVLAKSIIFQVLSGVSHLHSEHVQIAHRDIKPSNVLLTSSCCAQLIDFGIAFRVSEDRASKARDLWPESATRMYFEVSTGPYRAPELLFGSRTYDPFAIDAWSLGTTFAECFTSLCLQTDDEDDDDQRFSFHHTNRTPDSDSDSESHLPAPPPSPFIIPRGKRPGMPTGRWTRSSLFDGTNGDIGLAWSIFKIRGTPTAETWPSFRTLPDAGKLAFVDVPATDLGTHLPNLPPSSSPTSSPSAPSSSVAGAESTPLDLVQRFLVYEPAQRLRPAQALAHPWFTVEPALVLPAEGADGAVRAGVPAGVVPQSQRSFTLEGQTHTLEDLLMTYVTSRDR